MLKLYNSAIATRANIEVNMNNAKKIFPDAQWIWSHDFDKRDYRMHFRRVFELESLPEELEIKITADSRYTLWINGEYVNNGPARGFQRHWPFDRIDISPYLNVRKNVIAVMAYQYGTSNYSYSYEHSSGFLLSASVGDLNLSTGANWKIREAPGYINDVARASKQYSFQEFFDCRIGDDNWLSVDYDDSAWDDNVLCRAVGAMPWHGFEKRNIPLLTKNIFIAKKIIARTKHEVAENWQKLQNIGVLYKNEKCDWQKVDDNAENISFSPAVTGQLIDFSQELVGILNFEIDNAEDGEILDFMVCESLSGHIPDLPGVDRPVVTSFGGRIILKKGVNKHELTLPWGFRYLLLFCRGASSINVKTFVRQTIYPLEVTGTFHSSDDKLNSIWRMSEHTQRCCMVDAYIDCPWRENAQWWGDALVQVKNTFCLADDTRLFERGLRQIASQKTPNGLTYGMAPTCGHNCILPDYSAMWIITIHAHYWQTGKIDMWLELRDTVDGILNYFESQLSSDGLLQYDDRYWLFLDWCPELHKTDTPTVFNLIYLWALQSALELAKVAKDQKRVKIYSKSILNIKHAIKSKLYNSETCFLYDGLTCEEELVEKHSPHTATLAIITDFLPEAHDLWFNEIILPLVRGKREEKIMPTSYFMYYIFEALKSKGYMAEVADCVRRWWSEFVDAGCSTTPESWLEQVVRGTWSFCHAWSAHPLVQFSEIILGVRQRAPGWNKISFDPLMTKGQKASGSIPSPHGIIKVEWDWTGSKAIKNIQLPDGIQLLP